MRQIVSLARLASANRRPAVLMGDFNMTARHAVLRPAAPAGAAGRVPGGRAGAGGHPAAAHGALAQSPAHPAAGPRVPGLLPLARVDYIWHTADLVALEAWVGADAGSDHLPVLARLAPVR